MMQPPGPHSLSQVRQPAPVRLDDEEDRPAVGRPHLRRAHDRDQRATGAYQRGRPFEDLAADHVEHHVDLTGVLQPVGLQVHERVRTQAQGRFPVPGPAGSDHAGAQLVRQLHRDRPDATRRPVDQDGLARLEVGVVEQALPGGQPGNGQSGGHGVVDAGRKRGQVAGLHRGVLSQRPVAGPVGQPEHPLAHGQAGGAVAQLGNDT